MSVVMLKGVRLAFANGIWEARQVQGQGKPAFSVTSLFSKDTDNFKNVLAAIKEVAEEKWGAKAAEVLKQLKAQDKLCLHDGNLKENYEGFADNYYVNARNASRPTIKDRDGQTNLVQADGKPYSGCYANVSIDIWAQENQFGKRINASLRGIQFVADGDAFSAGGVAGEDEFDAVEGSDEKDPFADAGLDDLAGDVPVQDDISF